MHSLVAYWSIFMRYDLYSNTLQGILFTKSSQMYVNGVRVHLFRKYKSFLYLKDAMISKLFSDQLLINASFKSRTKVSYYFHTTINRLFYRNIVLSNDYFTSKVIFHPFRCNRSPCTTDLTRNISFFLEYTNRWKDWWRSSSKVVSIAAVSTVQLLTGNSFSENLQNDRKGKMRSLSNMLT